MKSKVEYFDIKIVNCNFVPGFRITIENCNIDKMSIVNFLSDNFGEGIIDQFSGNDNLLINSESWHLFISKTTYRIILKTLNQVEKFFDNFNISEEIDFETLCVQSRLENKLEKYMFEPNTQKTRNKIREDIRKILNVKPYDFDLIINDKGIQIIKEDFSILINGDVKR